MKPALFACGLVASLCVGTAEAGTPDSVIAGTAVYLGGGYRFVELQLAGHDMVCAVDDRAALGMLTKGSLVDFHGRFANYAGLYDLLMVMEDCDIAPRSHS